MRYITGRRGQAEQSPTVTPRHARVTIQPIHSLHAALKYSHETFRAFHKSLPTPQVGPGRFPKYSRVESSPVGPGGVPIQVSPVGSGPVRKSSNLTGRVGSGRVTLTRRDATRNMCDPPRENTWKLQLCCGAIFFRYKRKRRQVSLSSLTAY